MDIGELSQPHGKDARGGSERKKRRFADRSVKSFVKRQKAAATGIWHGKSEDRVARNP